MRALTFIAAVFLLCGCTSEKRRFDRDMQERYEVQCDKYYSAYCSGSIEDAKKTLHDIIDLSQAEKGKAKFYWRFDAMIAFAEARLAVIAEMQGHEDEASRLFAVASDDKVSGDEAFRVECRKEGDIDMKSLGSVQRMTPELWRKAIAALDKVNHVKWESPNTARGRVKTI
ncbi:MAG TPA: hypothetical protein VK815_13350 [Candidatus Acidoferrales bacterium]|jgi:hypothetical protein|nr:hypothetical protein [Candidatus Acidoferrales bacterium]